VGRSQAALLLGEPGKDYLVKDPFSELSTIVPDLLWLIQNEKEESSQRKEQNSQRKEQNSQRKEQNSLKMELDMRTLEPGMKMRVPHMKRRGLHKMNHHLRIQDQIQNTLALETFF
jgi:hypothetical protein